MRYFFNKNSFFASIFVYCIIGIFYFNPLNTHIFNPLKISLTDFSLNDFAFSQAHLNNTKDDRIIIINIDTIGRKTIGSLIEHVHRYSPKVIGLDILLPAKKNPANIDLYNTINNTPEIVLAQKVESIEDTLLTVSENQFADSGKNVGYVNFRAKGSDVVRYYPPFLKDTAFESFSTAIIKYADYSKYYEVSQRRNINEWINYQRTSNEYFIYNYSDILDDKVDSSFIRNKIVLIGFVSKDSNNIEDKHFTPLNSKVLGKSIPDMYGVVINANIISMILDHNYIKRIPSWLILAIGFIGIWAYMGFLLKYYLYRHLWFHLAAKTAELIFSGVLVYLSILILRYFSVSIDFTFVIIAIVLSVDCLYFYEGLRNWLEKKFSINSEFNKSHK